MRRESMDKSDHFDYNYLDDKRTQVTAIGLLIAVVQFGTRASLDLTSAAC